MTIPGKAVSLLMAMCNRNGIGSKHSLRLKDNFIFRNFTSNGDRTKMTIAFCYRPCSGNGVILSAPIVAGVSELSLEFVDGYLQLKDYSTNIVLFKTESSYIGCHRFYNFVVGIDTTQASTSNRIKIAVNNSPQILSTNNLSQNQVLTFNSAVKHSIGRRATRNEGFLDAIIAEIYLVGGKQLSASNFGYSTDYGLYPKNYNDGFANNDFYLNFKYGDIATTSEKYILKDHSGLQNDFTGINIVRAASINECWLIDHPTCAFPILATDQMPSDGEQPLLVSNGGLDFDALNTEASPSRRQGTCFAFAAESHYVELTIKNRVKVGTEYYPKLGLFDMATGDVQWLPSEDSILVGTYGYAIDYTRGQVWVRNRIHDWAMGDPVARTAPSATFTPKDTGYKLVVQAYNGSTGCLNFGQRQYAFNCPNTFGFAVSRDAPGQGYQATFYFNYTITSDTYNFLLRNAAIDAGWDQVVPLVATITVPNGVTVGSISKDFPAFDTGANYPLGSLLTLIKHGNIVGKGGNGGNGGIDGTTEGAVGGNGEDGGPALRARFNISITNDNGFIAGGGGGGGGQGGGWYYYYVGGGGGGGAGYDVGHGGLKGTGANVTAGIDGTLTTGGLGGNPATGYESYGKGGKGGDLGQAGTNGPVAIVNFRPPGGLGGQAGYAVLGNAFITWTQQGTIIGPIA